MVQFHEVTTLDHGRSSWQGGCAKYMDDQESASSADKTGTSVPSSSWKGCDSLSAI